MLSWMGFVRELGDVYKMIKHFKRRRKLTRKSQNFILSFYMMCCRAKSYVIYFFETKTIFQEKYF